MNEIRENKMGTMPVNRLLLTMAFPMVISMLVQALYNIVDSLYVARIDPVHQYEFTAISLAFAAQCLLIAVATGTGVGINALLSRSLGEKDYDKVNRIAANGAFLYAISYVVFLILGLFCMRPYMSLMTHIPQVIDRGAEYLSICFIFSFGLFGQIYVERLLISTGKTQLSMLTQLVGLSSISFSTRCSFSDSTWALPVRPSLRYWARSRPWDLAYALISRKITRSSLPFAASAPTDA